MGICVHCMQPKPITANKCPHCHERTGLLESAWWTILHKVLYWVMLIFLWALLFQCAVAGNSASLPPQQEQMSE